MNQKACISIAVAGLSLALAAGCKKPDEGTSSTKTTSAADESRTGTTNAPSAAATPLTKDDREFMTKAAQGSMLEVALGQEVSKKATTADVKAFGHRMVTEHGKAGDELKKIAASKGATLPTELDKDHREKLDELSKLSGAKLDKEYADDVVEDHEEDVKEFKKAAQDVKDPDLRAWAAKTVPILESHLAKAKEIKAKTKH